MKKVKFCKDCKWSRSDKRNYGLHCVHPLVVANYPWALSRSETPYETDEYNRGEQIAMKNVLRNGFVNVD